MQPSREEVPLRALFAEFSRELGTLVRQEVTLAKTELSQKTAQVGKNAGMLVVGAAVAYAGFLALVATVIVALAAIVPWWLSALIVGVVVAGIGLGLVYWGQKELKHADLAPRQTIESLKEDAEWMRRRAA